MSTMQSRHFKKNPLKLNELLTIILDKLKMQQLISLRVVCKNWKSVIESICKLKPNLRLNCASIVNTKIRNRFFGELEIEKFVVLKISRKPNWIVRFDQNLSTFLGELFTSVDQLIVDAALTSASVKKLHEMVKMNWPNVTTFSLDGIQQSALLSSDQIKEMKSLKKLDLVGYFNELPNKEIFAKLEHFSCHNHRNIDLLKIMPKLGPKCTSFWLGCIWISVPSLNRWFKRNSVQVLTNLTHLGLSMVKDENESLFRLISENFHSLQVLSIRFIHWIKFSHNICSQLVKLSNLSRLTIGNALFDLISLEDKNQQTQVASIHVLYLIQFGLTLGPAYITPITDLDGARFCRILASIFPNLEELGIYPYASDNSVHDTIGNNLNQFGKFVRYKMLSREFDF